MIFSLGIAFIVREEWRGGSGNRRECGRLRSAAVEAAEQPHRSGSESCAAVCRSRFCWFRKCSGGRAAASLFERAPVRLRTASVARSARFYL